MKIKWNDDATEFYEAVVWENGNNLLLDEYYTTKSEAVEAVKAVKKSYKVNGELDCYVRYYDYWDGTTQDFNL